MKSERRMSLAALLLGVLLLTTSLSACGKASEEAGPIGTVQPVELAPRLDTLEGKTVGLFWNGKINGDRFLNRVAELLSEQVENVKVIKIWEVYPDTAGYHIDPSYFPGIVQLGVDIVILSQGD